MLEKKVVNGELLVVNESGHIVRNYGADSPTMQHVADALITQENKQVPQAPQKKA
jgi:hypothetical protein